MASLSGADREYRHLLGGSALGRRSTVIGQMRGQRGGLGLAEDLAVIMVLRWDP